MSDSGSLYVGRNAITVIDITAIPRQLLLRHVSVAITPLLYQQTFLITIQEAATAAGLVKKNFGRIRFTFKKKVEISKGLFYLRLITSHGQNST
jgi:hypothetical protein